LKKYNQAANHPISKLAKTQMGASDKTVVSKIASANQNISVRKIHFSM
jgi:hypothetical protein